MARPYIPPSDKNGSLMTPMSAGLNTPISYRANVNRQKTKKWTEAKKIDYGGDDWGDDDDYDPYDAYGDGPEPASASAPAPVSKPIALRQQSQGLASARGMSQDRSQKSYGNLPSASAGSALNRRNSFEADDETRHFSNSTLRQETVAPITSSSPSADISNAPATRFSQMGVGGIRHTRDPSGPPSLHILTQEPPQTQLRKPLMSANPTPPDAPYNNNSMSLPSRTNTYDSSILSAGSINTPSDYETSRDFSPSAVPSPLTMRPLPAPQSATNEAPTARFPARKSSLSTMGTEAHRIHQRSQETLANPLPTISARSPSPGSSNRSTITPGASNTKPLPFIRPADIYRRVEEEKQEKERSSLDSARPSMDSIRIERSSDRSDSPGQGAIRERSSSDSLGPGYRGRHNFGDEGSESARRLMPILEPVEERKSEHALEGLNANEIPSLDQKIPSPPAETKATSPQLPDFHRLSGFGTELFFQSNSDDAVAPPTETTDEQAEKTIPEDPNKESGPSSLRSQPSFGFRSVVNQAFDDSVPPTPLSKTGSNVKRSDSESTGTTGISPIMSRGPSTAIAESRNREISIPAIKELAEPGSPMPRNVEHKNSEEMLPPNFIPGHRRDISTPSPGNSPARTPDLGNASKRISMGEQAWISSASPTSLAEDESGNADHEPERPTLDRDVSFRPELPGGWQSYTTTATTSTLQPESVRSPSPQTSGDPAQDIAAIDLTPATTKHTPPDSPEAAPLTLGVKSDSMPTPDLIGNVHSAMTPQSDLIPTLVGASLEAQSRPDVVVESIPTRSPPPPPAEYVGTSNHEVVSGEPHQPTLNLQQRMGDESSLGEPLPLSRPQVLPTLSTDTGPLDEENDKLRKEIVRSLSPLPAESEQANENRRERGDNNLDESRESAYLTDVYDDYWNDAADEEHSYPIATTSSPLKAPTEPMISGDMPEIKPLSSHRLSKQKTRPPLPTRFSWERSMESIHQPEIGTSELPGSHVEIPIENIDAPHRELQQVDPEPYMEKEVLHEAPQSNHEPENYIAVGAAAAAPQISHVELPPTFNVSLAQATDQPQSTAYPITPTLENEQSVNGSTLDLSTDPLGSNPHSPASNPSLFAAQEPSPSLRGSANSPRTSNLGKILTFKEILAMKDVHERVHAFDETRERFAAMDSGLHEWIFALKAEQPEHEDVTESYGGFRSHVTTGSTRRNTKSGLQSPYYQQYLNASTQSQLSAPAPRPGQIVPSGIQQGFSPAHAKITTQQVQAKGKELLHTAGMFGGKAGKAGFQAGKGLLAKGKNRLRAAGSSDKTSPPPQPRYPNRSSWGLALSLSRATGRMDSSRHAEQNIPFQPTSRSQMSHSSGALTSTDKADIPSSDDEAQAADAEEINGISRENAGEILAPDKTKEQHIVNLPESTSKFHPTWDLYHATHINDEGKFANGEQTNHHIIDADSITNKLFLLAGQPRSTRSNSAGAAFYHAPEEQLDSRNPLSSSLVTKKDPMQPTADLKQPTRPPISMMNRPRGASLDQAAIDDQVSRTAIRPIQTPLSIQSANQDIISPEEHGSQSSFRALPPIRRTSKFGFEFGSRRPQTRFPISDDEDDTVSDSGTPEVITSDKTASIGEDPTSQKNPRTDVPIGETARDPKLNAQNSPQPRFSVFPRVSDPFGHNNQTQDLWRSRPAVKHTRQDSWNDPCNKSRSRRGSASDHNFPPRRDSNAAPPLIPNLPFESPPSSAQRYPELFRGATVEIGDGHNISDGCHKAPAGHSEVFPPRQHTSELPEVRPPQSSQEPTGHRRRRSSDLVNRGMNFVRSISRERRGSVSRDEPISPIDTSATPPSRGDRQIKRGSGFWGNFDITGAQPSNSPVGRESMVAHYSGSQSNLMASSHDSPRTPISFPNPTLTLETPRSNLLGRSTTTMGKGFQKDERKSRLGGLSGIFSRSPKGDGSVLFKPKRATTDLSSFSPRVGTLSSPQYLPQTQQDANADYRRRPSQPLNFLSKFAPSTSLQKSETPRQDSKPHQEPRPRRPSVSGLLTGMLRKRSNTLDRNSERGEDDGRRPVIVPAARMYSDLPAESQEVLPDLVATPTQRLKKSDQERGRTRSSSKSNVSEKEHAHSRSHHRPRRHGTPPPQIPEPQYDSVPIPGVYNLVRGDGTTATPTNYDLRGINNPRRPSLRDTISNSSQQYSIPSPVSPLVHSDFSTLHPSSSLHQTPTPERKVPDLKSIDTHSLSFTSPIRTHYPSHEDILARSPAREQPGQQRPFQLTLPHGSSAGSRSSRSSTPPIPPPKDDPVVLRSPASVPLPADEFSHLNEKVDIDRFPLPPSPPQHSPEWYRNRNLSVATDDGLQRSGTGRSLVSAVSQISDSPSPQPQTDNVEHILHVDGDNNTKMDSGNLYDASSRLPREEERMARKYVKRSGETEMANIGGIGAGDGDGREIGEKADIKAVEQETKIGKEERLQMSATSYPGMEWNPYAGGYPGDE